MMNTLITKTVAKNISIARLTPANNGDEIVPSSSFIFLLSCFLYDSLGGSNQNFGGIGMPFLSRTSTRTEICHLQVASVALCSLAFCIWFLKLKAIAIDNRLRA